MGSRVGTVVRWCAVAIVLGICPGAALVAGENGEPDAVRIHDSTRLAPPEGAPNQDAEGAVHLRQRGERMAIHVFVRNLEPGATYDVTASREVTDDEGNVETETAELGSITTRDATPPPPRCFKAYLSPPVEEEEDGGGAWWWHHRDDEGPRGIAVLYRNREATELRYCLRVYGLTGAVTEASIDLGNGEILELELDEELCGSMEISADQLEALASGEASVTVQTDADEELGGQIEICLSLFERIRSHIAEFLAGTGALRLDTAREDEMPFGVTNLADLEGATVAVNDGDGNVVLSGIIGELSDWTHHWIDWWRHRDGDGAGGAFGDEDEALDLTDDAFFFDVGEPHDASITRGDVNDDSSFDVSDAVFLLLHLFAGRDGPYCSDTADADDNGQLDIADAISMLRGLFQNQEALPGPQIRGFDRTPDGLFCDGVQD